MPESKAAPTEKSDDRPVMNKRVERKEDGRTLIYYNFDQNDKAADRQNKVESGDAK